MNMPRPIGGSIAARAGMRTPLALPQSNVRRRRSKMVLLVDAGGGIRGSYDGITWRAGVSPTGTLLRVFEDRGVVVTFEAGQARSSRDLRQPWTAVSTGTTIALAEGFLYEASGAVLNPVNGVAVGSTGVTHAGSNTGKIVCSEQVYVNDGAVSWYALSGVSAKRVGGASVDVDVVGEEFGGVYLTADGATIRTFNPDSFALVDTLATGISANGVVTLAVGNGVAVAVGDAGAFATMRNAGKIAVTGTVGFTANNLSVCLFNGEVFICAGAGGVVGYSYDGVNWTAGSSGTASNINYGCISSTVFPL